MDWFEEAKQVFNMEKPAHFTNFKHCEECAEHDLALINSDVDHIGIEELGQPGDDPIVFCTNEGKKYYMPALIRLCTEPTSTELYVGQLLFHLESDGPNNDLFLSCSIEQRQFIRRFVYYLIEKFPKEIDMNSCADNAFKVLHIWSA